jgi:hypothetical protein
MEREEVQTPGGLLAACNDALRALQRYVEE